MYITGALEKFAGMTKSQIQAIGVENAGLPLDAGHFSALSRGLLRNLMSDG